jgi:hypothetical protein
MIAQAMDIVKVENVFAIQGFMERTAVFSLLK